MSITAFGICYALSSYIVGYSWNIMWLEVMIMLPLILAGIDRLIKKAGRKALLCCLVFLPSL
ncbi:YfhO family protein [Anaerostipes caccae]|uniref:YfhO family protein n=1 Tax=Anaerostipes caccae TaxID=105841 RepID=UPI0023E2302C